MTASSSDDVVERVAIELYAETMRDFGCCDDDVDRFLANPHDGDDGMAVRAIEKAVERQQAEIAALTSAVTRAADIFERYADMHRQKGTAAGEMKAQANSAVAAEMRAALERGQ